MVDSCPISGCGASLKLLHESIAVDFLEVKLDLACSLDIS